jgi:hypothetical protein
MIEINPPEEDRWITQKALYAYYDEVRLASMFVESDKDMNAIYGYEIDGQIKEIEGEFESWEEAEHEFLLIMQEYFDDQIKYYKELYDMIDFMIEED